MIVLALSDIHERTARFKSLKARLRSIGVDPDLAVVAGDLTYFKKKDVAIRVLNELTSEIGVNTLFIPGNCDSLDLLDLRSINGKIFNIHGEIYELGGYVFYGVGGSGITPFNTILEYSEEEFRRFMENLMGTTYSKNLVIVTHQPIYGYFDSVNDENTGSRVFLEYIERLNPVVWITGHIHEHSGWTRHSRTVIVHPGPFTKGYFAIIQMENSEATRVVIERV